MAEPLPPEGFIRIKDAFDTFRFGWIGDPSEAEKVNGPEQAAYFKKIDAANAYFVENLGRLAYGGRVIAADGSKYELTGDIFDRAVIADLLPWHDSIPTGTHGPLENYVGGIVCFNSRHYFEWLQTELPILLHGEIQNGELTPVAANERLAKINLPALDAMPPLKDFRDAVLKEPYWTLPMAVAWIAWRNIDDVVKQHWPYAQHGGHWRDSKGPNQSKMGAVWESASEPSLRYIDCTESVESSFGNQPSLSVRESQNDLWSKLQAGDIAAIGIEGGGSHRPIAKERWVSLEALPFVRGREYIGVGHEKISDVQVLAKDVLRIWSEVEAVEIEGFAITANVTTSSTVETMVQASRPVSENELHRWFSEYKANGNSLIREAIEQSGKAKFGERVTITRLRACYELVKPLGGNKRGRKSAKSNSAASELSELPENRHS